MSLKNFIKTEDVLKVEIGEYIPEDTYLIRINNSKIQTGTVESYCDEESLVLKNVINASNNSFFAEEGILKISSTDELYIINSFYNNNPESKKALHLITNWALYVKHANIQKNILSFVKETFPPALINFMKENGELNRIFIPIQQKFKIGKFAPKKNWDLINRKEFKSSLENLLHNDYVTYMGHIPRHGFEKPMFFTTGKISHLETDIRLKDKPYQFSTNCGGNIKFIEEKDNKKYFLVDAGASYKGPGVNATKDDALEVIDYLKKLYPEFHFVPTNGRNAIGTQYSF